MDVAIAGGSADTQHIGYLHHGLDARAEEGAIILTHKIAVPEYVEFLSRKVEVSLFGQVNPCFVGLHANRNKT